MTISRAERDWRPGSVPACARCAATSPPDQLTLFKLNSTAVVPMGEVTDGSSALVDRAYPLWPRVETSACGRPGFWRPRTPAIFGPRAGVGPLLVFPDNNILISLHQQLDETEAFMLRAVWSDLKSPIDALCDLIQLWWWRDVRFRVSSLHLIDARKQMTPEQEVARHAAVRELRHDFYDRGGYELFISDAEIVIEDRPCALHSIPVRSLPTHETVSAAVERLPRQGKDKALVLKALEAGCHVFVTCDRKVLRCHGSFLPLGLAILSPAQLLEELDASGELDECENPLTAPSSDISSLSCFYGAFASDCFDDLHPGNENS
jgi:hypothetical protein